jgi:hypothetical protein
MFNSILKDQKLPGYAEKMTVEVAVQSLLITEGNLQAQWSIGLPQAGPRLPGTEPPAPLFKGNFNMLPPAAIMQGLGAYFQASAPALVDGLSTKADAAAKLIADAAAAAAKTELDRIAAQAVVPPVPTAGFVPPPSLPN